MSLFKKQFTIGELMNIDSGRQQRAMSCSVELEKVYHELKKDTILEKFKSFFRSGKGVINSYYVIFKFSVDSGSGSKRTVIVRVNPDFNLQDWESNKVKIYCDCPDFKYRSAYILNQHNSLFLNDRTKLELGSAISDAPKGKAGTTLLCKHAFAALNWLVSNYVNVMKTI